MKFASLLALGALASALPSPNPEPEAVHDLNAREAQPGWCHFKGQGCWKVKRAAEALTEALSARDVDTAPHEARASSPETAAAKRAADTLASIVASTTDDPEAYYAALYLDAAFPSAPAAAADDDDDAGNEKRDASPQGWCHFKGQGCWKAKRDNLPRGWCHFKGQSCWKARRAASAVIDAIGGENFAKREELPRGWCGFKGQSCWKRDEVAALDARCNAPGGVCALATRDLHAMYNAARSVLEEFE